VRLTLKEWHRKTFAVHLLAGAGLPERAELVQGVVCGPFGIYAGNAFAVGHRSASRKAYTLVHLPSQTPKLKLPRVGLCRQAALEFAECDLAWESAWAPEITGPDLEKAREIHRRWTRWGER
jgi:hypothetical protein